MNANRLLAKLLPRASQIMKKKMMMITF